MHASVEVEQVRVVDAVVADAVFGHPLDLVADRDEAGLGVEYPGAVERGNAVPSCTEGKHLAWQQSNE